VFVDDTTNDELFMRAALDMAIVAASHEDVPVGCVLVENDVVIGVGENRRELDQDPTSLPSFSLKCFARCGHELAFCPIQRAPSTLRARTIPFSLRTVTIVPSGSD